MMRIYLSDAIKSLRPGAEFSYTNDDYSTIKWDILEGSAPTQAEIDAEMVKIESDQITNAQTKAAARTALLERLGITADEAALLLG